jgi:hypothetical protein
MTNPFDKMLEQIAQLIQYTYDNANKPIPPEKMEEVLKRLNDIELQVQIFQKESEKIMEGSGVNDFTFNAMLTDDTNERISKEDRNTLLKAQLLKTEVEHALKDVRKAANEARASGKKLTEKKKQKSKSPQARKGKFRSMGGYKDWKPL